MTKRHIANAMYIAKSMGRKGYANEGSVKDPNDPLGGLTQDANNPNQWLQFAGKNQEDIPTGVPISAESSAVLSPMGVDLPQEAKTRFITNAAGVVRRIGDEYIPHSDLKREQNLLDWFGESAVKNPDGSPKVVYHGSGADFSVFRPSSTGEFGPGIYASSLADEASSYAGTHPEGTGSNVMPIHIRMEQPFVAKNPSDFWEAFGGKTDAEAMQNARKAGYDGVIITRPYTIYDSKRKQFYPTGQDHTHYVVFDPSQIKSATGNSGHFGLRNPDITKSEGGRTGYLDGGMPEVIDLETEAPDTGGIPDVIDLETPMPEGTDTGSSPMSYAPDDEPAEQPSALAAIAKIAPQAKKPVPVEQPYATAPAPMSRADETWGRMLQQESNRQHFDQSGRPKISSAGAVGIAQVKPATGKEAAALAGEPWNFKRFHSDPEYNERLGRAYYDKQLQRFGDPTLAAAAYNAGPSRLSRALDLAQSTGRDVSNFLPAETRKYIRGASGFADGGSTDGISIVDAPERSTEQLPDNAYAALYEPKMVRLAERQPQTDQPASINREYMPFEGVGSVSAGANAGPVRGNVSLSGQHGQTPSYGMNLGLDLPGDLVASYNRSGEAGGRSRDANNALSIAKKVGKGQVGVNTSKSGEAGPRSYGAQFQYPLGNKGGSAGLYADYTPSSKDLRGGVRFQRDFATGGAIADRAIMLLSKKAKRQPGRG